MHSRATFSQVVLNRREVVARPDIAVANAAYTGTMSEAAQDTFVNQASLGGARPDVTADEPMAEPEVDEEMPSASSVAF